MEKNKFYSELKDALELSEDLNENSPIALSSLHVLSVIALVDENFDIQLKASDLKSIDSVGKLMSIIGTEKFS
jgi:acyl carrier protein